MLDPLERHSAVPAGVTGVLSGVSGFPGRGTRTNARRHLNKHILSACTYALLMLCAYSARAQQRPVLYNPQKGRQPVRRANPATNARRTPIRSAIVQNGKSCNLITFEGLGDLQSIPAFDGISSPGWLSIIEDAAGGSGNFSNEPSPVTTAFWLDPNPSEDIVFAQPVSTVSFYYASLPGVGLTAYDSNGTVVASAQGGPNYDYDNNTFDNFWPISVDAGGNKISRLTVSGNVNQTGIDNLYVCSVIGIDSVEVTQAIQQWQSLSDLEASLTASQEPPVPIISGKPAVLRVYMDQVTDVAPVTVQISGVYSEVKPWVLTPNCDTADQRAQNGVCQSIDFYFTPPSGAWQATLDVLDSGGNMLEEENLSFTSRDTNTMLLRSVKVCDTPQAPPLDWLCGDPTVIFGLTAYSEKIYPTAKVTPDMSSIVVRRDTAPYANINSWWADVDSDLASNYGSPESMADASNDQRTTFIGMIRPSVGGLDGKAAGIPSNALAMLDNTIDMGVDDTAETLAHEEGHTLDLLHTNTGVPAAATPPGCYAVAPDPTSDWPLVETVPGNYIQSTARLEVGFDVAAHTPIDPNNTFEIMGYCLPQWIAPQRYKTVIATLGGGTVASPSVPAQSRAPAARPAPTRQLASATGPYWLVRGVINGSSAQFGPLFQISAQGSTDPGTGTYALIEQTQTGQPLFTRFLTPQTPQVEGATEYTAGAPFFSEMLPVQAGVAAIVLQDSTSTEIGRITFAGSAPVVAITVPSAGFVGTGTTTIFWTVQGPASYTSKVRYSPDNGATWSWLGDVQNSTSLAIDFDPLPGSTQALMQVLVSDGVNTGSATSPPFTVPRHTPISVLITSPSDGFSQPAASTVHFTGNAYDIDDGVLSGSALQWTSSLQGVLGTGSPLDVKLQPGAHKIDLTATDSDGNAIATQISIIIGGQPPVVSLQVTELDHAPTTCVNAVINAYPGANGAALSRVQYSLNGGLTYYAIPLNSLPFGLTLPGGGYFHMIASATDLSGQSNVQDATFFTQSACKGGTPAIANIVPSTGHQGQTLASVTISGQNTHFAQGTTVANFGAGITVNSLTVNSSIVAVANITIAGNAAVGSRNVTATTGAEVATGSGAFTVTAAYAVSVTPNNGASSPGTAQSFVFAYSDGGGSADLAQVSMLINSSTALTNACNVAWFSSDNTIRLYSDDNSAYTYATAAGASSFGNSQCTISYNNPIVSSGNNLTMTLSITFATGFIGTKNVYMEAQGTTGGDSGMRLMGTWAVTWVPMVASVGPNSGHQGQTLASVAITGQNTHFAPGITVASFGTGITVNSLTVNSSTAATASISIAGNAAVGTRDVTMTTGAEVAPASGGFAVTAAFPVSVTPGSGAGSPGTAESFVFAYSDLGGAADFAQVSMLINSSTALSGACYVVWLSADNSIRLYNDAGNGYTHASAAGASSFGNSQCTISYNNPIMSSGNNLTMTLSITFATAFLGTQNVYMEAQGTTGGDSGLQLMGTWNVAQLPAVGSVAPNSGYPGQTLASVAITGQNTNFVQGTTVASFGAGITVNSLTVSSSTAATASISIAGNAAAGPRDVTMTTGAEVALGSGAFTVTAAYPVSVTPNNGASSPGTAQSFVFAYSDGSGSADLAQVSMLINSSTALTNACNVAWVSSDNTIRLYNDTAGGYLYATAAGASSFGNSQCTISYNNPIVSSGNNLTMTLSITFASGFIGAQNVYMEAQSTTSGASGLQLMGTWAVMLPVVGSVAPNSAYQGQTLANVAIAGRATNFVQGTTVASFGPGVTVNSLTVNSSVTATANITVAPTATPGANTVTMTTGSEVATLSGGFSVTAGYPLTLNVSPAGSGSITANPASGSGYYGSGTSVQLTAVPASGYIFSGFSGDLTGSTNPQRVTMAAARSITATFTLAAVVPNVARVTQANATAAIVSAGLVVGTVTTAASGTVPAGDVISQSPVAGTQVNPGSAVNLVVSTGPVLLSITVTPANPWTVVSWTEQFAATGNYTGNTTQNLTNQVTWASSATGVATVSALGLATGQAVGASTISATLGTVSGSTVLTVLARSKCDTNADGVTNVADVQWIFNEVLGLAQAVDDLIGDGVVNVAGVQIVINAVMGLGCMAK